MISETVSYTNFNNEPRTKKLWFHMSKQDVLDNLSLKEQVEALQEIFSGEKRQISILEITQILELVKRITKIAYGEKSADGERFRKGSANPDVWDAFFETPAYDQFIESKFMPDPSKALEFFLAVMPPELRRDAEAEAKKQNPVAYAEYEAAKADGAPLQSPTNPTIRPVPRTDLPAAESPFVKPAKDISSMTREEIEATLKALQEGKQA
jgi:hypothetical protein